MARALRLAVLGRHASPNPMVGCVIVDAFGAVAGDGYHVRPGELHAERVALAQAGERARGGTAYVTLEPCAHHGRTPPCADALIQAGVARVCAALVDPDVRVSGQGIARLRAAGLTVDIGLLEDRARALNAAFIKHRTTGVPFVCLKTAQTLDGKIATRTGDSRWITSPVSRLAIHRQLRDRCDAILVGVGTVLADDPSLTTRLSHKDARNPLRIIVDSHARTALSSAVVRQSALDGKTIIAVAPGAETQALADAGCQIIVCADDAGRVSLPDLMARLGTRGDILSVLVEGGAQIAAAFLEAGLVDRWLAFVAPKIAGGQDAPGPVGGTGVERMASARPVYFNSVRRCGPDIRIDIRFASH